MAKEIKLPKVSMGQTEGSISEWLVEEGTWVDKDQLIMLMETEKVAYELESPEAGFIVFQIELLEAYPCGTVVALVAETEEELAELQQLKTNASTNGVSQEEPEPEPAIQPEPKKPVSTSANCENNSNASGEQVSDNSIACLIKKSKRIKITPVAKKKAAIHNLDISQIKGSGPNGRIKNCDVEMVLAAQSATATAAATIPEPAIPQATIIQNPIVETTSNGKRIKTTIPLRGMRKAVAEHLKHSQQVAAQTHWVGELDMKKVMKLRKRLNAKLEGSGDKISYNDILVFIMAKAIKKVPIVNSSLINEEIIIWEDINIALAVAVEISEYESGLYTPVIKNADQKSLLEISRISNELVHKGRNGNLTTAENSGATITLSPIGSVVNGYAHSTPIINQPQAYIITSGAIVDRVMAHKGKKKIRPIMPFSMTFDHRIMDGVPPIKFFNAIKEMVEDPDFIYLQ